jgi:hypothetical protein
LQVVVVQDHTTMPQVVGLVEQEAVAAAPHITQVPTQIVQED